MTTTLDSPVPNARHLSLVTTRTGSEMMVFDTETNQLHHLNPLATAVWTQLDGKQAIPAIAVNVSEVLGETISIETVTESVRLLSTAGLLESTWAVGPANGSRRSFLRRAAVVGAASVPVIMSITAPSASAANSDACGKPCVQEAQASDNVCKGPCSQCNANPATQYANTCCHPSNANAYCWSTS